MVRVRGCAAQALVESALVLPMLLTLSLGVLQVALYAHARDVMLSAVQEGARLAAEDGRSLDEGYVRAQALMTAGLGSSVERMRLVGELDDELVGFRVDASLQPIVPLVVVRDLPLHAEARVARERFRPTGAPR
jgi:hypothetical protein